MTDTIASAPDYQAQKILNNELDNYIHVIADIWRRVYAVEPLTPDEKHVFWQKCHIAFIDTIVEYKDVKRESLKPTRTITLD